MNSKRHIGSVNVQIASAGLLGGRGGKRGSGSGLGIIRLGSAEKTELGLDIKHRPGLREDKLGRK